MKSHRKAVLTWILMMRRGSQAETAKAWSRKEERKQNVAQADKSEGMGESVQSESAEVACSHDSGFLFLSSGEPLNVFVNVHIEQSP